MADGAAGEDGEKQKNQFNDPVLDQIVNGFIKKNAAKQAAQKSAAQESAELIQKYEGNSSDPYHDTLASLHDTANKIVVVTQKMEWQHKVEESPLLTAYEKTKQVVLRTIGKPAGQATRHELVEQKMGLVRHYQQQLMSAKEKVDYSWNQLVDDKTRTRGATDDGIKECLAVEEDLKKKNELYEKISQRLTATKRTDPEYAPLAEAKDELRRRIELGIMAQQKAKQDIYYSNRKLEILDNHEEIVTKLLFKLAALSNETNHCVDIAEMMDGLSGIYKEGKSYIETMELLGRAAVKAMDIDKETRDISDTVLRASASSEINSSEVGRLGRTTGRYKGILGSAANTATSIDQEVNNILNSYGK